MRLKLEIVTGSAPPARVSSPVPVPVPVDTPIPPKASGRAAGLGIIDAGVVVASIAIAIILSHPGASKWWDKQPKVQEWQKFIAENQWVVPPTRSHSRSPQPQEKPIFPLKYPRRLTGVPGDCRPIALCRSLGLSKYQPGYQGIRIHAGADFPAPVGTPVLAPISLKITATNPGSSAGGIISAESLDGKQYFRFVHLGRESVRRVKVGQVFKQGETIALIGFEPGGGWGTGPHLHFERYLKSASGKWELDWNVEDWVP